MNFSQVAGTSAGAIAAAFIATGAAPRWIIDELLEVDFACFQGRLAKGQWLRSKWRGVVVLFRRGLAFTPSCWTGMLKAALDVYLYGGAFSSEALETWIDSALKRLLSVNGLKTKGDKVCFRDLPMPLTIVASDIANGSYKIWSQEDSLDESVAFAARCSSSIPLFFQPVRRGDRVFVDGGMLANAPSFVFREKKDDDAATYAARLVTFRLVKRVVAKADLETTGGYFERLGTTVVDGASAIQEELQPSRSDVRIDTGAIGSTDFDKVTDAARRDLVDAGRVAVRSFVENEEATMRGVKDLVRFVGRDQQALFLVQLLSGVPKEVTVYDFSSVWLHICFPSFLKAMRGGTSLRYVCRREADKPELHRRRLFEMMGGVIEHVNEIPFKGVVAYGAKLDGFVLVSDDASPTASYETEVWRAYSSLSDPVFFKLLEARCKQLEGILASPNLPFSPRLELVEDRDLLLARLGRIPQYQGATFRIGDVRLDHGLLTHQTYVKEYKYLQADITVRLLKSLGRDTFDAYAVDLGNGHRTMITPPIVEVSGRERMVVKGHSRALFCLRNGVESMRAVIVEGPQKPLPDSGKRLVDLALASRTRTRTQQYPNVDDTAWRRIEEAVHPEAEFDQL
jgi:predicted acylesterase/phospholipase RssA